MIASKGMPMFRAVAHSYNHGRAIHLPSHLGRRPPLPKSSAAAKDFWQQTRLFVNRLLYGATPSSPSPQFARSFHSIRSQLSLPARHALTNPLGNPFLPRPPMLNRSITQVGLGTARNFGTARPIFQAIAENVPVTARAAYEMDWDVQRKRAKARSSKKLKSITKVPKTKKVSKVNLQKNYEQYFAEPPAADVTTQLIVPLVPHGAEDIIPNLELASKGSIVPRKAVSESHAMHTKHAVRINSLFLRLDQAKVWERGAHYEAFGVSEGSYGHPGTATCTTINIVFEGWTREMVQDVIGEAGRGWCLLKEVWTTKDGPGSVDTSIATLLTESSPIMSVAHPEVEHDFIMPTLDFSSSFLSYHAPEVAHTSRSHSPFVAFSDMTGPPSPAFDAISLHSMSDHESDDDLNWNWSRTPSSMGSPRSEPRRLKCLEFSAEFMSRGQEYMNPF